MKTRVMYRIIFVVLLMSLLLTGVYAADNGAAYAAASNDPGKITSMTLTVTGQPLAKLSWKEATGNANGYTIVRNGKSLVRLSGKNVLSYVDESLKPGNTYTYMVVPHYKDSKGKLTYGKASPARKVLNGYSYKKESNGTMTLTGFTGRGDKDGTVATPAKIGSTKVGKIGNSCFRGNVWIKDVTVSGSVSTIDDYAFEACGRLDSVTLPKTVKTIGDGAFSGCAQMRYFRMPPNVTSIGKGAFLYCSRLTIADLPASLQKMGEFVFAGCERLNQVNFRGNGPAEIPDRAFCQCSRLEEVVIPAGTTSIGKRAFSGCEKLQNCTIQGSGQDPVSIGDYAFETTDLYSLEAGQRQVILGFAAFSSLQQGIPVGTAANLILPDNVSFGDGTFYGSRISGLANAGAMQGTPSSQYILKEGVLYSQDETTLIAFFPMKMGMYDFEETEAATTGTFTVPDGVTTIAPYAFYGSRLKKVILPESLQRIEHNAFTMSDVTEKMLVFNGSDSNVVIDAKAFENHEYPKPETFDPSNIGGGDTGGSDAGEGSEIPENAVVTTSFDFQSLADGGIFDADKYQGYLDIHEGFADWCLKYIEYNKNNVPMTAEAMPYISMYTGEDHYRQMASVLNGDTFKTQESILRSGDDYRDMYLMIDHGLFAELSRGRMPGDLLLYSGITSERVSEIAGREEKASGAITDELRNEIVSRIGSEFSDPAIMSTTASVATSFRFSSGDYGSKTIVMIYGSKEALDQLGTICVDEFSKFSGEEETLFNANARYRILDVGTIQVMNDWLDPEHPETINHVDGEQRTYVKLQLLGGSEGSPTKTIVKNNTMKVSRKTVKVKKTTLKKKSVKIARKKAITVKSAKGTVTYKKKSGNKKILINKKTGKVTIKKGLGKGTYKVKLQVTAAGNYDYRKAVKTVTLRINVR